MKVRMFRLCIAVLGFLIASCSPQDSSKTIIPGEDFPKLASKREEIREFVKSGEVPSFAIGVINGGEIIWQEAFGFGDLENRISSTPDTAYRIGSTTKSLIATGVSIAAAKGFLDMDTPVSEILGEGAFDNFAGGNLKIRDLMNMTGGLPHLWYYRWEEGHGGVNVTHDDIFERYLFSFLPPGKRYYYSNLSSALGEKIIEKASGKKFEVFMQNEVFKPLGMTSSVASALNTAPREALAYGKGNETQGLFAFEPVGGGGFKSSLADLVHYALFHLKHGDDMETLPLSSEQIDALHFEQDPERPNYNIYAHGWGIFPDAQFPFLVSDGQILGGQSLILLLPNQDFGVVVLSNIITGRVEEAAFSVAFDLVPGFAGVFERVYKTRKEELEKRFSAFYPPIGDFQASGFVMSEGEKIPVWLDMKGESAKLEFVDGAAVTLGNFFREGGFYYFTSDDLIPWVGDGFDEGRVSTVVLTRHKGKLVGVLEFNPLAEKLTGGFPYYLELDLAS